MEAMGRYRTPSITLSLSLGPSILEKHDRKGRDESSRILNATV
jgi:hypothetical protein